MRQMRFKGSHFNQNINIINPIQKHIHIARVIKNDLPAFTNFEFAMILVFTIIFQLIYSH
jgi:hypothetical protein